MWREIIALDYEYLFVRTEEVAAVTHKDECSTLHLRSGLQFVIPKLVGDTLLTLSRPTFKTMEGGDIEVNLALVRTAVLLDFTAKEWHYQLKFGDDGFLEVLSDRPISL